LKQTKPAHDILNHGEKKRKKEKEKALLIAIRDLWELIYCSLVG